MGEKKAFEILKPAAPNAAVFLTCEHASNELPTGKNWQAADRWLAQTHWAWDIGAALLTRDLSHRLQATAVLARYSRLWADLNRTPDEDTLFRNIADGRRIALNDDIDADERAWRLEEHYAPYYRAVQENARVNVATTLLSVHTFTPVYEGGTRQLQMGVLFDKEEELGMKLASHLRADGVDTECNQPYSGRQGLMYCVQHCADIVERHALEIELRQDLAVDPFFRRKVCRSLGAFFEQPL